MFSNRFFSFTRSSVFDSILTLSVARQSRKPSDRKWQWVYLYGKERNKNEQKKNEKKYFGSCVSYAHRDDSIVSDEKCVEIKWWMMQVNKIRLSLSLERSSAFSLLRCWQIKRVWKKKLKMKYEQNAQPKTKMEKNLSLKRKVALSMVINCFD